MFLRIHLTGKHRPIIRQFNRVEFINYATMTPDQIKDMIRKAGNTTITFVNAARIESLENHLDQNDAKKTDE